MNFKTTIVLLVLLVLVGLVWLLFPHLTCQPQPPSPTVKTETETEKDVLEPKVSSDSITKVVVERPGKPRLVFTRAAKSEAGAAPPGPQMENWQAVEPLAAPVQTYQVDTVVSTFTGLRSRKQFEAGAKDAPSDADARLSPPAATVTLSDKDGKEYKFEVGGKAAMSTDTYVRVVGQKTIQIATRDLQNDVLKKEFKDYRDKKLTNLAANDAVKMEIATAGKTYVLTRGPDQAWVFDVPVKAFAVKEEVLNLTRKVGSLSAQEFIDDAPASLAEYGLDQPYMTVSITTETKKKLPAPEGESATQPAEPKYETTQSTYALLIGGFADLKQDKRYAKVADRPWVVSVSESDVKGLVPDPLKLRDPKITRIKAADATSLEITSGGATATLRRSGPS